MESVFECVWRADQIPQIRQNLQALIDPAQDRLWLARVPVMPACCRRQRPAQDRRTDPLPRGLTTASSLQPALNAATKFY